MKKKVCQVFRYAAFSFDSSNNNKSRIIVIISPALTNYIVHSALHMERACAFTHIRMSHK